MKESSINLILKSRGEKKFPAKNVKIQNFNQATAFIEENSIDF